MRIVVAVAGSLFLGYRLAALGLKITLTGTPSMVAVWVPVLVLGVPIFDTTLVTWQRLAHGRSPMKGGRDHSSHRLVWVGIPVPISVLLLYAAGFVLAWLAVLLARLDTTSGMLLVGLTLSLGAFLLLLLGAVPVYENSRRRGAMLRVVREHDPEEQAS